jgi:AraC-like DNA-binding protein
MLSPNLHHFANLAKWSPTAAQTNLVLRVDNEPVGMRDVYNTHVDFFALYLVRQGRGIHIIDGVPHGIARGDLYVMGIGTTHAYSGHDDLSLDSLYFPPEVFDRDSLEVLQATPGFLPLFVEQPLFGSGQGGGKWLHLAPDAYRSIRDEIEELRQEWLSGTPEGVLLTRALFLRLLIHLSRLNAENPQRVPPPSRASREAVVSAAVRYLDEHFAEPIRIEQLAHQLFLSPDRFTELFTAGMGRTPRDYLRHLRIERAKFLLATTDTPVNEIGLAVGMADPAYFNRAFRSATSVTPLGYRREATKP